MAIIEKIPGAYDPESVRGMRLVKAALSFVVLILFAGWLLFHPRAGNDELKKNGGKGQATVYQVGTDSEGVSRISYDFRVNGIQYVAKDRVVRSLDGVKKGGLIPFWYDRNDPNRCTTADEETDEGGVRVWPIVVLVTLAALCGWTVYAALLGPKSGPTLG